LVAVILLTLGMTLFHVLPMVRNDLRLLNELKTTDVEGFSLESQLQFKIQESRRGFLRALLARQTRSDPGEEIRVMLDADKSVAQTEDRIRSLRAVPAESQQRLHASWQHYLAVRNQMLDTALRTDASALPHMDADVGKSEFVPVVQAVQNAQSSFQTAASEHVRKVTAALNLALWELVVVLVLKTVLLSLLIWMDWRRGRVVCQFEQTSKDLKASEDRFRQAYESASVGMGVFALDGTVLSANRMAAKILGLELNELIGMKVNEFMAPEFQADHLRRLASLPGSPESSYQTERRVLRKDGTAAWVRNSVTLLRPEGQEPHYFSISEEITLQKEANGRLSFLANFDPVTNLPNRHSFENLLVASLQPEGESAGTLALLYVEIDSFDFLKGTFGRTVADEVLTELGASLTAFCQPGETVGRLDDHVFGFLIPAQQEAEVLQRATELKNIFHQASGSGKHRIPLSASIGIACVVPDSDSKRSGSPRRGRDEAETLLKYARAAMLEARSRGGDSIYLADPDLQHRAAQRHQIESALLQGLREDEFRVVFQPQFQVASGKLVRFEALCRWTSKELGPIPPDRFIPIAEQTGFISEIGRRILHDALRQAKVWTDSGRSIGVAVNISPMQFMRPDFTQAVVEALSVSSFPPALLELEITEGIFIRDLNVAVSRIRELQRLGLSIALDDFGTGYSSLSYLQRMPIDAVKLDRSFVSDLTTDPATVSMVRSVLSMADALNLRVVTEGVETEEQLEILRSLGCDEAQGYLLGRPESADMALRRVLESPICPVGTLV
jgi:PAS domain S-box-containing protein/diguanylate cyclase (GGDEF)-like protein